MLVTRADGLEAARRQYNARRERPWSAPWRRSAAVHGWQTVTGSVPYHHRKHSCAAKQNWAGRSVGSGDSSKQGLHPGGRLLQRQPSACRHWPHGVPRCTRVAEVMLRNRNALCHAEKRDGSDQQTVRAGSGELGTSLSGGSSLVQHTLLRRLETRGGR